jgi:Cu+-exporting ATPase
LLRVAASLGQHSTHPFSTALLAHAPTQDVNPLPISDLIETPGKGLQGKLDGEQYIMGSPAFLIEQGVELDEPSIRAMQQQGESVIAVAHIQTPPPEMPKRRKKRGEIVAPVIIEHISLGYIAFSDKLRPTSILAVHRLREMGIRVVMLSGDNQATAQAMAKQSGIDEFIAEVLPQDKARHIISFKSDGGIVGMVGDGINDAPALAAADVSFAMKSGSDIAIEAADITLMRNDLSSVADAIDLSRVTLSKIRQNLFFAFAYNILGIPLAAMGLLNPIIAGGAMAMSSVSVVSNALLLKNWRPGHTKSEPSSQNAIKQQPDIGEPSEGVQS